MFKQVKIAALVASVAMLAACGGGGGSGDVASAAPAQAEASAIPMGTVSSTGVYQGPAQIRARYGFNALPASTASNGSGQLIAIISSYNNPDLIENVATFSAKYGLPNCTVIKTAYVTSPTAYTTASVPRGSVGQNCTIQVVNLDSFGRPTTSVASSNSTSWNAESSMDAEWVHAMAPGANILIVQAPSPFVGALSYAAGYASNVAKADVVSMSWGAAENSIQCVRRPMQPTVKYDPNCSDAATSSAYWNTLNANFAGPATLVAASGDSAVLQWPSTMNTVLAVGGTAESGATDIGWAGSGGGLSVSYKSTPAQQAVTKQVQRSVPDVDRKSTAVAVYIKPNAATGYPDTACVALQGAANCGWYGAGGTSAGAPQWAGIVAINNATRLAKRAPTIDFLNTMYTIAATPASYSTAFVDITIGNTSLNTSKVGYDLVTGLGVPNASVLVGFMSN